MTHQEKVLVKMVRPHFVVGLVGRPVIHGDVICGDDHAGAIVAEEAMRENFLLLIVAQQL